VIVDFSPQTIHPVRASARTGFLCYLKLIVALKSEVLGKLADQGEGLLPAIDYINNSDDSEDDYS